jgi:trehalose 6-phosphate synthase
MHACGGTWVAHGSGDADREMVDEHDRIAVPPEDPKYTLRRVWLSPEDEEGFYYGLSNGGLWPLCHITFTRPVFEPAHWEAYERVNRIFAQAVLEEVGDEPAFVFIQDFHFCLLPRLLKQAGKKLIIAHFWHIPWPNREVFRAFPWGDALLDGLLGNDLLGFHVHYHCQNFLDTVDRSIEALVDPDRYEITRGGRITMIRPFPISIDFAAHDALARTPQVDRAMDGWRRRLGLKENDILGIGIERLDYTKGIPDRLRAIEHLLESSPDYHDRLRFIQVAVPSRSAVPEYRRLEREAVALVEQINARFGTDRWLPITWIPEHQSSISMMALHRLAHFGTVSSLHDGMNLVAKEFVASRFDLDAVLILSKFTGAARELADALQVNPFAIGEVADAMRQAIEMPVEERQKRMERLRDQVAANNVYRWAGKILSTLLRFEIPEGDA